MIEFNPLKHIPQNHNYEKGDQLVIFGEVFDRGYVNGLIDEAGHAGLKVIYSTVGRREKDGTLRELNKEELSEKSEPLINVPLEAGFDLTASKSGISPVDQLKSVGLKGWQDVKLDWNSIHESKEIYESDFRRRVQNYVKELVPQLDFNKNIIFVHTMAGGFPRAKAVMPIANKVFKGVDDRYQSSKEFWDSDIGKLCEINFESVTADTLRVFIEETKSIREEVISNGKHVSYSAFGYHGNQVLIDDKYEWHSYSPYLQGWAKLKLEAIAKEYWDKGIPSTVYNVPEILTNSSSIFLGIEVVIYPLLKALQAKYPDNKNIKDLIDKCNSKLKEGHSFETIDKLSQEYLQNPLAKEWPKFESWPQHNGPDQMKLMRNMSASIIELHKDNKDLMTKELSEIVFKACGYIMFRHSSSPTAPVVWIGHNAVVEVFNNLDLNS